MRARTNENEEIAGLGIADTTPVDEAASLASELVRDGIPTANAAEQATAKYGLEDEIEIAAVAFAAQKALARSERRRNHINAELVFNNATLTVDLLA